jgi:hypothetical protein
MDVIVTKMPKENSWGLKDLLGRDMGCVTEIKPGVFKLQPAGKAKETMAGISAQSYRSLDAALASIETHTRGSCRETE